MARKYPASALLCLVMAGVACAEVNTPRFLDDLLSQAPQSPSEALSREGVIRVTGEMLSSPCSSGRLATAIERNAPPASVVVVLEGCGEGVKGVGARLPVTLDVMPGAPSRTSLPRAWRLSHGNNTVPLSVRPDVPVLRVEVSYE